MTQTGLIQSVRGLSSWIRACIAIGAVVAMGLGTIVVAGGNSARSHPAGASAPAGSAASMKGVERSGTLSAYMLVY